MRLDQFYTEDVLKYSKDMDITSLENYVNQVYTFLLQMKPGKKFNLHKIAKKESIDLFKSVIKMYIDESEWSSVEFIGQYDGIRKMSFNL